MGMFRKKQLFDFISKIIGFIETACYASTVKLTSKLLVNKMQIALSLI